MRYVWGDPDQTPRAGSFGEAVHIDVQNFDRYALLRGRIVIPREKLLGNIARVLGTDFYVVATK
jgi:hypothetical protein